MIPTSVPHHAWITVWALACVPLRLLGSVVSTEPEPTLNTKAPAVIESSFRELQHAQDQLETGNADAAVAVLDELIRHNPRQTTLHAARMLRGQIRGVFAARQDFWMQRRVADLVVLVPDEAAFLKAVAQWTPQRFWPILIEDGWFTPMFLRSFLPTSVWRATPDSHSDNGRLNTDLLAFVKQLNATTASRVGARPRPPGIVMLDPESGQRMGGIALACGRGQPAITAIARAKRHEIVPFKPLLKLNAQLMTSALQWRINDPDSWFAVTLAGPYPYRYQVPGPKEAKPQAHSKDQTRIRLRAVDDLLGRIHASDTGSDLRVAVVGRLTGPPSQAVYQAMCSLFLQPRHMLWVDTYAHEDAATWETYDMRRAVELLAPRYASTLLTGSEASVATVRSQTRPSHDFGMIWINSRGGPKIWHLGAKATTDDFPIGTATAMHVVHSFSMARPWNIDTLAGRAIAGGAYWYFGSVAEPYLVAFNRPTGMMVKILAGTPPAFAARQVAGQPRGQPWRLMLVGDPLFSLRAEPARRELMTSLPGAFEVKREDHGKGSVPRRLRRAVFLNHPAATALAEVCLEKAASLDPDDLILALGTLYRAGRFDMAANIPHRVARSQPMAAVLARLSRLITGVPTHGPPAVEDPLRRRSQGRRHAESTAAGTPVPKANRP